MASAEAKFVYPEDRISASDSSLTSPLLNEPNGSNLDYEAQEKPRPAYSLPLPVVSGAAYCVGNRALFQHWCHFLILPTVEVQVRRGNMCSTLLWKECQQPFLPCSILSDDTFEQSGAQQLWIQGTAMHPHASMPFQRSFYSFNSCCAAYAFGTFQLWNSAVVAARQHDLRWWVLNRATLSHVLASRNRCI